MRKLISLLIVLGVLFVAGPALADSYNSGTGGWAIADAVGDTYTRARVFGYPGYTKEGHFRSLTSDGVLGGVYSSQSLERSGAWAVGKGAEVEIEGYGYQYTGGELSYGNQWVQGDQGSDASYWAYEKGPDLEIHGFSKTTGGAIGGLSETTGWQNTGTAWGAVGSYGEANADRYGSADRRYANVSGSGGVEASSYAQKGSGEAWTGGYADYSYDSGGRGDRYIADGGYAHTCGTSAVSGSSANATHTSYSSTGGPTHSESHVGLGSL